MLVFPVTIPQKPLLHNASLCALLGFLVLILLNSCQPAPRYTLVNHAYDKPRLGDKTFTTNDRQSFLYRKFIATDEKAKEPKTVVIALHGFCGASIDYENLGNWLVKEKPEIALYAYDIRGQGMDPIKERRGDIDAPENWFHDLNTFTALVRREHPRASIVWQGESMGALILANTYRTEAEQGRRPGCDAIIITSPVVGIRGDFPAWKKYSVRAVAKVFPAVRLSLDTLSGGQKVQMTATSTHSEQSETNAWHIERHTLRLLVNLHDLIEQMNASAASFRVPTLIVHGGKDFFTDSKDVVSFYQQLAQAPEKKRLYYPKAHHLLMYDAQKDVVIQDIGSWIADLPPQRKTADTQR
jgi:alpha-beta hydrolase superfamily lysophospholipase